MSTQAYLFSLSTHPDTINVKSLDVHFLNPKIDFSNYDYLIITSKQAVEALKQYEESEYLQKKALAISKKSAQAFEKIGGTLLEIGEGYGSNISENIQRYPKKTKWLYLRASVIASDFVNECTSKGYTVDEATVYESHCSQEIQKTSIPQDATLIFTSPSSVVCFLKNHTISNLNKVIVIGKTTAKELPEGVDYALSGETSIESCVELFKNL
jgi:uroporphyrinogen-III synthase